MTATVSEIRTKFKKPIHPRSILVIEDDLAIAETIKRTVESINPKIKCVINSEPYEALLTLADQRFDFALIDQRIPGWQGCSLLRKLDKYIDSDPLLSENEAYIKSIPVAILSGEESESLERPHFRHFRMMKFVDRSNLQSFLNQALA